jgi:Nif-specific regulatory protein
MKPNADRIKSLVETFSALLDQERHANHALVASLVELVKVIQGGTGDKRLQRLAGQLKELDGRLDLFANLARTDHLAKIEHEADDRQRGLTDGRVATVIRALLDVRPPSLDRFCASLLDRVIEVTGAERGFILFYQSESTEADIIAARDFQTTNLSLGEYGYSRTLLREVLQRNKPLLLEDASRDSAFSSVESVRKYELKSVLAIPLQQESKTVGAIYLENNKVPGAFDASDLHVIESVALFATFYLQHARLLPVVFDRKSQVVLDADKAATELVGKDPKMLEVKGLIARIADSPATVLIEGESGTGKELVARALHEQSARRKRPFVAINCAAIPENLLESELFGHERGAYTGATDRYIGLIAQGDEGTVFLDEVAEMGYPLQAKVLRVLQSGEFQRLGGGKPVQVDVRFVAAASKNLKALVRLGKFQEALYYRLNVVSVRIPALRERRDDIPLLVEHFLEKYCDRYGTRVRFAPEMYVWLSEYAFPGNVRELENLVHRLVLLARDDAIRLGDLPAELLQTDPERISIEPDPLHLLFRTPPADMKELRRRREEVARLFAEQKHSLVDRALNETSGNLTEAAKLLDMNRVTLHRILRTEKIE